MTAYELKYRLESGEIERDLYRLAEAAVTAYDGLGALLRPYRAGCSVYSGLCCITPFFGPFVYSCRQMPFS